MSKIVSGYKEAARARILDAAIDVFTKHGFDDSTMDEVAAKVGVTKAALYRYFRSKNSLLESVFRATQRRLRVALEEAFERRTVEEGVKEFFQNLDRTYGQSYDLIFEWFAQASRDPRIRRLMRADGERDIATVTAFLERQRKGGRLQSRKDARMLAQILETAFVGGWIRIAMGHDRRAVVRSLQDLVSALEHWS